MSLRVLIYAGLRVYAIYYAVQTVAFIPTIAQLLVWGPQRSASVLPLLVIVLPFAIVAGILWFSAERLAAAIIRNSEPAIDKFTFTLETAYTFSFFFLGLYFVLSSIASFLQQLYYLVAVVAQLSQNAPERSRAFFDIYRPGITLIAGFASLLGAPFWARKLVAFGARIPS
jgi:hypothetical protein